MKKLLVLNFYPAFTPPTSGGELRYFNTYRELSRRFDVTLLAPTYSDHPEQTIVHSPSFREHRIPKEPLYQAIHAAVDADAVGDEVSGICCAIAGSFPNDLHAKFLRLLAAADVVVHEHPFMLPFDLSFGLDGKPRVYSSQNHEVRMFRQLLRGPHASRYLGFLDSLERRMVEGADLVVAISADERAAFVEDYGADPTKVIVAPNGIDGDEWSELVRSRASATRKRAIFIGSAHPPNVESVTFLVERVAPKCPDIDFEIAGSCTDGFVDRVVPTNVRLLGRLDDAARRELFARADLALNPMFSGGGSNVKTVEYMAAGLPVIATPLGVRGVEFVDGVDHFRAEPDEFAAVLARVVASPDGGASVGRAARTRVLETLSWHTIVSTVASAIDAIPARPREPHLVVLNDFSIADPVAGGEVRLHHLYRHLAKTRRVTVLCLNDGTQIVRTRISDRFEEISVPKSRDHLEVQAAFNALHHVSANDILCARFVGRNVVFTGLVEQLAAHADAVVLAHPYLVHAVDRVAGVPIVHESLNFETALKRSVLRGHPRSEELIASTEACERLACHRSSLVVVVSDEETDSLRAFARPGTPIVTIRNGVDVHPEAAEVRQSVAGPVRAAIGTDRIAIFVASAHPPNVSAAVFLVDEIAPALPNVRFVVVGSVCDAFAGRDVPSNVLFFGRVSDERKNALLASADVALNPMSEGAGSNVKLAEFFAWGLPTVTTGFGARGYSVEDGVHAVVCELADFVPRIRALLDDRALARRIGTAARAYADAELDWSAHAADYARAIDEHVLRRGKTRVLVVTYRLTDPPLGGAEVFLLELLQRLQRFDDLAVDVATLDVRDVENLHQFGNRWGGDPGEDVRTRLPRTRIHVFPDDRIPEPVALEGARLVYDAWMRERRALAESLSALYDRPILLGGFHFPESSADGVRRWTSDEAVVFVGGRCVVELSGYAPFRREIELVAFSTSTRHVVDGPFTIRVDVDGDVLRVRSEAEHVEGDSRRLGVCIAKVLIDRGGEVVSIDLAEDYTDFLKRVALDAYVDAMMRIARQRDPELDALFLRLRGPNSLALDRFLDARTSHYDVVIGHSVPFRTSVVAMRAAERAGIPGIVLPHFHLEDDFYHWDPFYSAMTSAELVLASSRGSIDGFFSKLPADAKLVGGGISSAEFEEIDVSAFRALHPSKVPFFLVLGRKAGAKNYAWIVDAVERLKGRGVAVDLVMIGRDEDLAPIDPRAVHYLGAQNRSVVLGALAECIAVVNMSESESLGIVVLEAWMAGRPVVVNPRCPAFAELVQDAVDGMHADRSNLVDVLSSLLEEPTKLAALASAGMEKARSFFTWDALAEDVRAQVLRLAATDGQSGSLVRK